MEGEGEDGGEGWRSSKQTGGNTHSAGTWQHADSTCSKAGPGSLFLMLVEEREKRLESSWRKGRADFLTTW
eukprot:81710-Hanusia_phi.AAC.3